MASREVYSWHLHNKSTSNAERGDRVALLSCGRRVLVIYIDGMMFGEHHVISAVCVDGAGQKHVLGIQPGATENAAAVEDLLQQLVARGVNPKAKRLFVIDGAKALRAAISKVFGPQHPVQRCRNHKIRNVVERLPVVKSSYPGSGQRRSPMVTGLNGVSFH